MGEPRSHAIVIGYRREDLRRYSEKIPPADIPGGACISCGHQVYFNHFGVSAIRERDADVCCDACETLYGADINRSLIES